MSRNKSIMRDMLVPLLFDECRIIPFGRLDYSTPAVIGVKDFIAKPVRNKVMDLPYSDIELKYFCPYLNR